MPTAVIDLFCGIGGLTHGLQKAGLNVVAGIDIDESCRYAFEKNNNAVFLHRNIVDMTAKDLTPYYPRGCTKILVGCAPCQPFSKYTQRYRKKGHQDDKWRLLYSFAKLVQEVAPEIVSMENVPELENEKVYADFVASLKKNGYNVSSQVVYCPQYGVPQSRKRLVLLASLFAEIKLIPPLFNEHEYPTVRQAIGNLPPIEDGVANIDDPIHSASALSDINKRRILQSVPGGTWRDWDEELQLKCHKRKTGRSYPSVYGRMFWDEPSPTITTQFFGLGNGRFGHPEQHRALTLREGAILQSFPPDYHFVQPGEKIHRRALGVHIGNAVPVELGRAIGISILDHLKGAGHHG